MVAKGNAGEANLRYTLTMTALPTPQPFPLLTSEEFLDWEIRQEDRHEFINGQIVAMAGNSEGHHVIAINTALALRARIPKPCRATTERMVKIPNKNWRFADVLVDCSGFDPKAWYAGEPRIAVEVESPSTSYFEEMERLEDYQCVPSIAHVLILAQDRPRARLYTRTETGWIASDYTKLEQTVALASLGVELPLAELYEGFGFTA